MEISCNYLWVEWSKNDPNSAEVLAAKEKLSKYTKDDWTHMSTEATDMVDYLKNLVKSSIDLDSKEAEYGFDLFVIHFFKWFFPISKQYVLRLSTVVKFDPNYAAFFNQFTPGLDLYMNKLLQKYAYKLEAIDYAKKY